MCQYVAQALQELLCKKTKTPMVGFDRLFPEFKGNSDIQITREMFEDALKDLQEGSVITYSGSFLSEEISSCSHRIHQYFIPSRKK